MFLPIAILLLVALTAVDLMLGKSMAIGLRRLLYTAWVVVALVVAMSIPTSTSNPGYDSNEMTETSPY